MNEIINTVGDKHNLPNGWINTDFLKTNSYSPKLIQYSSFYKSYLNDVLVIRTIKDEYLIAMKMVSARKYKNDYADIYGIIKENPSLNLDKILNAFNHLYGQSISVDDNMINFIKSVFDSKIDDYNQIRASENGEKETLLKKQEK